MTNPTTVAQLKRLRADIDDALANVLTFKVHEHLKLKLGNCRYDADGSFTFKIEGTLPGGQTKDEQAYEVLRIYHTELPPLGATVSLPRYGACKIVGGRSRAKFNVVVMKPDGARTCFKAEDIVRLAKARGVTA